MTSSQDNGLLYKLNGPGPRPEHAESWELLMAKPDFQDRAGHYVLPVYTEMPSIEVMPLTGTNSTYHDAMWTTSG